TFSCCKDGQVAMSIGVHVEQKRRALRRRALMHERIRRPEKYRFLGEWVSDNILHFFHGNHLYTSPPQSSPNTVLVIAEAPQREIPPNFEDTCRPSSQWCLPCFFSASVRERSFPDLLTRR
ncbi:unnamed protein product, partial [Laminaria digitata]